MGSIWCRPLDNWSWLFTDEQVRATVGLSFSYTSSVRIIRRKRFMARRFCLVVALLLLVPALSLADTINIGLLSFDGLVLPGTNIFNITNYTGDSTLGGNNAPLDFPVVDLLSFLNISLDLVMDDGSAVPTITLDHVGPGSLDLNDPATLPFQFPDTSMFLSGTFAATLSQTTFLLSDG